MHMNQAHTKNECKTFTLVPFLLQLTLYQDETQIISLGFVEKLV